jgi:hypothetical protein
MIEFDSEMVVRFQDMRSPISYFSKVYGFDGFLNFYKNGNITEAVVTFLRGGKTMDELRKAIRTRGFDLTDRKAGVSIRVAEECYICDIIDSILKVKGAFIDVPVFVKDGDAILRIKYFNTFSSEIQRLIFKDSEKRDFFSIDYLGPVRSDKEWLLENAKSWDMKKMTFYVVPKNSFTMEFAKKNKGFSAQASVRYVDRSGFLDIFYEVDEKYPEWEKKLVEIAKESLLVKKTENGTKVFFARVPEQGILIDPYKLSDVDLPFNYDMNLTGERSMVMMIFEISTMDSFFRSMGKLSEQEFQEAQLEIKSIEPYP